MIHTVFKEDRGVRKVTIAEDITLPPKSSCDVPVSIENPPQGQAEGIIYPKDSWRLGLNAGRILTMAKPKVLTRVLNQSDQSIMLFEGESFGQFKLTTGTPLLISSVLEGYGECLQKDEDLDEPMVYEDFEDKKLDEVDFGLSNSGLEEGQKRSVRDLLSKYQETFQWDQVPVTFTHRIKHKIVLKPGVNPVKQKNRSGRRRPTVKRVEKHSELRESPKLAPLVLIV